MKLYDSRWRRAETVAIRSHMANVVTVNGTRYLVDVGYGADGPCRPVPLVSGNVVSGTPNQKLKLEYRCLPQHSDSAQRVWVYSHCRIGGAWEEVYQFPDVEFFAADFTVLNFYNMALSSFAKTVVVQRFEVDPESPEGDIVGTLQITRDRLERRSAAGLEEVAVFRNEQDRLSAFQSCFDIHLTEEEQFAIRGRPSELLEDV